MLIQNNSIDYYKLYQYNIWHLINTYNLKYEWLDITNIDFYILDNNQGYLNFKGGDPWLKKYANEKIKLAEDILINGTFTPFFYQKIDNKYHIIAGKHRIYSLKLYSQFKSLKRKFLFIELPNNIQFNQNQLLFNFHLEDISKSSLKNTNDLINHIVTNGDLLTYWLFAFNIQPFNIFNNEILFTEWIKNNIKGDKYEY